MKILQVSPYYSPRVGGVERHVQYLSEALVAQGHQVTVATMMHDSSLPHCQIIGGVEVRRFHKIGSLAYGLPIGLETFLLKEGKRFDVIHAHNYHALPLLVAAVLCRDRVVVTPHFHGHGHTALAKLLHVVYGPVAARALRDVRGVICVSAGEADLVARRLPVERARIAIVPNIIDAPTHPPTQKRGDGYWLLSIGRLETYKRVDRVIKALRYLPPLYRLAVIGTGGERARLEVHMAEQGVGDRVQFLGSIGDLELADWYHQSDLVLSFSEVESFGRVVVEALQYRRRVVCSDIPAFRELAAEFPDAVFPVTPDIGDEELARVIESVCANTELVSVDLERFSSRRVAAEVTQIYRQCSADQRLYETSALV